MAIEILTDKQKNLLDRIKNEGHKIGHLIGYDDLTEFHSKLIKEIVIWKNEFDWIPSKISPNSKGKDVQNSGMYEKKEFFKYQKLLMVMLILVKWMTREKIINLIGIFFKKLVIVNAFNLL